MKWLSVIMAASLLLNPFAAFAVDYGSQTAQAHQVPPVAQTLVREGDFAIKLAAALDLGTPTDEAIAEDMLAKAGIAPLNGWISDYPMTPQIVGQVQDSVAEAAGGGKLPMTAEEAGKGFTYLVSKMNLPSPAGPATAETEQKASSPPADQAVINNYYYDEGPPIVTYYPPPAYYGYLYDWVPYPVWWVGFWFPGFFICHSFTTTVVVHTGFVPRTAIVSNRVINPVMRSVALVLPVTRSTGGVRAVTTLRTTSGQTFRSVTDFRSRAAGGSSAARTTTGFRSAQARTSAQSIYSRSIDRMNTSAVRRSGGRSYGYGSPSRGRSYNSNSYTAPSTTHQRSLNTPSWRGERYAPQNAPSRYFNSPSMGRGSAGGAARSFSGNGWHR